MKLLEKMKSEMVTREEHASTCSRIAQEVSATVGRELDEKMNQHAQTHDSRIAALEQGVEKLQVSLSATHKIANQAMLQSSAWPPATKLPNFGASSSRKRGPGQISSSDRMDEDELVGARTPPSPPWFPAP